MTHNPVTGTPGPRTSARAWLVWALGMVAHTAAVFHRSSLGVTGVQAQHRLGTGAAVLSVFSVLQLAVYAAMQVPVGALLDRLGSRRMIFGGAVPIPMYVPKA